MTQKTVSLVKQLV